MNVVRISHSLHQNIDFRPPPQNVGAANPLAMTLSLAWTCTFCEFRLTLKCWRFKVFVVQIVLVSYLWCERSTQLCTWLCCSCRQSDALNNSIASINWSKIIEKNVKNSVIKYNIIKCKLLKRIPLPCSCHFQCECNAAVEPHLKF